ncbi:hypothetical protein EBR43_04330 [bacterium]|nr:hypothetical protein [bacterium]NBX71961.1 hypothetical protein [bacterium]
MCWKILGIWTVAGVALAGTFYDHITLSPGLSYDQFFRYSSAVVGENYHSISPKLSINWFKNFGKSRWGIAVDVEGDYDIELHSKNMLNNGQRTFNAHSFLFDGKLALLYKVSKTHDVSLALGAGAGSFSLKTFINANSDYTHYAHAYLPFARLYKNYNIFNVPGSFVSELSRVDCYYFQGMGYRFENIFWLQESSTLSQGIKAHYNFWNLNLGLIRNKPWISALHSAGLSYEVRFK